MKKQKRDGKLIHYLNFSVSLRETFFTAKARNLYINAKEQKISVNLITEIQLLEDILKITIYTFRIFELLIIAYFQILLVYLVK